MFAIGKKNNIQNLLYAKKMQLKTLCIYETLIYMGAIWKVDNT